MPLTQAGATNASLPTHPEYYLLLACNPCRPLADGNRQALTKPDTGDKRQAVRIVQTGLILLITKKNTLRTFLA